MLALKTVRVDTFGLASASQIVDRTFSPVVFVNDGGTSPSEGRKLYLTHFAESVQVKRSRDIKFSRAKRKSKAPPKRVKRSKTS